MKDQRMVGAFITTVYEDVVRMRKALKAREQELAGWVNELTEENKQIYWKWLANQESGNNQ